MLVEFKEVCKHLGSFYLDNISFQLPAGYIMGLIGPNGAGKTSLIHLLLGLYQPEKGDVCITGMNYETNEKEIHEITGTVLLDDLFDHALTLSQNGNEYGRFYKNYQPELLQNYLNRFQLKGNCRYRELSKGEKLKFQLAFALAHEPRLLILDEPTGNFDPAFRKEFFKILKEFIADGKKSVILSTHLTEDLDSMADYICYLESGRLLFQGDIETLRDSYRLVTGELYKINLLRKENIIYTEQGEYGCRALIKNCHMNPNDHALTVTIPTIEELMYFMTKRGDKSCTK